MLLRVGPLLSVVAVPLIVARATFILHHAAQLHRRWRRASRRWERGSKSLRLAQRLPLTVGAPSTRRRLKGKIFISVLFNQTRTS